MIGGFDLGYRCHIGRRSCGRHLISGISGSFIPLPAPSRRKRLLISFCVPPRGRKHRKAR